MGTSKIGQGKNEEPVETGRVEGESAAAEDSARSGMRLAPSFSARVEAALAANSHVEAALEASNKADAALADVFRTTKFLTATVSAVREANAAVTRELESLAETVAGEGDDPAVETGLVDTGLVDTGHIPRAERVVGEVGHDAERQRLIAEHDQFIAMLLADHERELEALRRRFAEIESAKEAAHPVVPEESSKPPPK